MDKLKGNNTRVKRYNGLIISLIVVLVLLSVNITLALVHFEKGEEIDIPLGSVSLSTNINAVSNLNNVLVGDDIVLSSSFSKDATAPDCYVRARIEFYSPLENLTENQENYLLALNAVDFSEFMSTGVNGSKWLSTNDNNYYLVNSSDDTLKVVNDTTVYNFVSSLIYPDVTHIEKAGLDIEFITNLKISIKFQGLQAKNLPSNEFSDIEVLFNDVFKNVYDRQSFIVIYDTGDVVDIPVSVVRVGGKLTRPNDPQVNGYSFDGWYSDSECTTAFDFNTNINRNYKIYAKFVIGSRVITYMDYDLTSVYLTEELESGEVTSAPIPPTHSDNHAVFNGWYSDSGLTNRFTFGNALDSDITLYPKYTFVYNVVFKVDGVTQSSQEVNLNNYPTNPNSPSKSGYEFDGWTIDGTNIVTPSSVKITADTTFTAKFTKLHTVTFTYEGSTYATQTVRDGNKPTNVDVTSTTYKVFNGWKLNGSIVTVTNQTITANTTFVADITYKYDVIFKVDSTTYNSQIVTKNGYPANPSNPSKSGYTFDGWSVDGTNVVNLATYTITANTTFTAIFTLIPVEVDPIPNGVYYVGTVDYDYYAVMDFTISNNALSSYNMGHGWDLYGDTISSVTLVGDTITISYTTGESDTIKYNYDYLVFEGVVGYAAHTSNMGESEVVYSTVAPNGVYYCSINSNKVELASITISNGAVSLYEYGRDWDKYAIYQKSVTLTRNIIKVVQWDDSYEYLVFDGKRGIFVGNINLYNVLETQEATFGVLPTSGVYVNTDYINDYVIGKFTISGSALTGYEIGSDWDVYGDSGSESLTLYNHVLTVAVDSNYYDFTSYNLTYNVKTGLFYGQMVYNNGDWVIQETSYSLGPNDGDYYYTGNNAGISLTQFTITSGSVSSHSRSIYWNDYDVAHYNLRLNGNSLTIIYGKSDTYTSYQYCYLNYNHIRKEFTGEIYYNTGSGRVKESVVFKFKTGYVEPSVPS